jgi:hypothetical protein
MRVRGTIHGCSRARALLVEPALHAPPSQVTCTLLAVRLSTCPGRLTGGVGVGGRATVGPLAPRTVRCSVGAVASDDRLPKNAMYSWPYGLRYAPDERGAGSQ